MRSVVNQDNSRDKLLLYRLYRGFGTGLFCLGYPLLNTLSRLRPTAGRELLQRTGGILPVLAKKRTAVPRIWFHAASVGEVTGVDKLITALAADGGSFEFVLTTMTVHGRDVATRQLPADVACFLAPLDVPGTVRLFIESIRPDLYVCMETELWPALLWELKKAGVTAVLLNGRMTERSFRRYRLVRGLMARALDVFSRLAVIGEKDKERFVKLGVGADRVQVTGNIKYDYPRVDAPAARDRYRTLLAAGDRTVFITGSTRSGEEEILAEVYRELAKRHPGRILWVVAPRHLNRLAEVGRLLTNLGLDYDRYTELGDRGRRQDIVLVDCLGELAMLYSAGDHLFVGGSLVAKGGHNIIEAARWGRPVYYGRNIDDFSDVAEALEQEGGGFRVTDGRQLTERIVHFMRDRDACRQACSGALRAAAMQQGAGARQAAIVKRLLQGSTG